MLPAEPVRAGPAPGPRRLFRGLRRARSPGRTGVESPGSLSGRARQRLVFPRQQHRAQQLARIQGTLPALLHQGIARRDADYARAGNNRIPRRRGADAGRSTAGVEKTQGPGWAVTPGGGSTLTAATAVCRRQGPVQSGLGSGLCCYRFLDQGLQLTVFEHFRDNIATADEFPANP